MSDDDEIIGLLRAARPRLRPAEVARLLEAKLGTAPSGTELVGFFKCAFPEIPTETLLRLCAWRGLGVGSLSDEALDEQLAPWWK